MKSDLPDKTKKIRKDVLDLSLKYQNGHIASALSVVEILSALYTDHYSEENRIILSKGHACLSLYIILRDKDLNPDIEVHPHIQPSEGICCTTGSLGHGLPIGVGMALAKRIQSEKGHVFVIIGDGECQEGTTWESLNLARRFGLDNLTIIVDHNKLQALGPVKEIAGEESLVQKFNAFGCNAFEVDGHDTNELMISLSSEKIKKGVPTALIAHTIKGKGISFMENNPEWHNKLPQGDLLKQAYNELR
jgi:transketolase